MPAVDPDNPETCACAEPWYDPRVERLSDSRARTARRSNRLVVLAPWVLLGVVIAAGLCYLQLVTERHVRDLDTVAKALAADRRAVEDRLDELNKKVEAKTAPSRPDHPAVEVVDRDPVTLVQRGSKLVRHHDADEKDTHLLEAFRVARVDVQTALPTAEKTIVTLLTNLGRVADAGPGKDLSALLDQATTVAKILREAACHEGIAAIPPARRLLRALNSRLSDSDLQDWFQVSQGESSVPSASDQRLRAAFRELSIDVAVMQVTASSSTSACLAQLNQILMERPGKERKVLLEQATRLRELLTDAAEEGAVEATTPITVALRAVLLRLDEK